MMTQHEQKATTPYIVIEATVGAGKTTLMDLVSERFGLTAYPEPVTNNPFLKDYYYNKALNALRLQFYFAKERVSHTKSVISSGNPGILDRSLFGDGVFAKMLYKMGELSYHEYEVYKDLMGHILETVSPPALMIRLDISVDEAIRRINNRGRSFEVVEKRGYWEELIENYDEFFAAYNHSPVLAIDVNDLDYANNPVHQEIILKMIEDKLVEIGFPIPAIQ